ncbi:MAG: amino acid adenylation domain-containing protein [Bacteroidota bacterium]|nr:amino acid adenylation domain-containing protein [Bacteroidota bacterium]
MKTYVRTDLLADISEAAVKYVDRTAIVIEDTPYTYRQLFEKVAAIYKVINQLSEQIIGIVAENELETYASILATLFAGKTYVILHPDYPEMRNLQIAEQAGIGCLLYCGKDIEVLSPDVSVKRICTTSQEGGQQAIESSVLRPWILPEVKITEANAYIIFTSGSTGKPKGVPISRQNLNAFYAAYRHLGWQLDETDRMLQMFELTFDVSVVSFLYPLTLGASVYTVPSSGFKYLNVLNVLDSHRLTFAAIAPSVLRLSRPYFPSIQLPELKYLVVTAEATDVNLLAEFRDCIPNATVINLYGPTEATIYCTAYTIPTQGSKHHNGMAAIGKPFPGMEVLIADEKGQSLPVNRTGELWLSGLQLMHGYWNAPEKSASCFIRHTDGKLYYKTGDLCSQDADGDIIYCGRKDTQVKIQGYRIELGEIEYRVKQFYCNAFNAVVIPLSGVDSNNELHLVIEKEEDDTQKLEQYLHDHLPAYMLPKQIHFLQAFPLNGSNKTDRKKITRLIQ